MMFMVVMFLLLLYMLFEAMKHKFHWKFGHEASLVCTVGLLISYIFHTHEDKTYTYML